MTLTQQRAEDFVTTWQQASQLEEICTKFNMPTRQASNLAAFYRTRGVLLKKFPRGLGGVGGVKEPLDWDRLILLAATEAEAQRLKRRGKP